MRVLCSKIAWTALVVLLAAVAAAAQEPEAVRHIHEKFQAAKPTAEQLAFFTLAWEPNLAAAKARAAKEKRPIALVTVHNITSACGFFSGHI